MRETERTYIPPLGEQASCFVRLEHDYCVNYHTNKKLARVVHDFIKIALKNKYLCAIIIYEFWKGTKIVDVIKSICDTFEKNHCVNSNV